MTGQVAAVALGGPDSLARAVEAAARLLPGQGPIGIFIHHNPLHAFEHLPFEEAVVEAGRLLGCEPFLSEHRYREELSRGRILVEDVAAVLAEDLGAAGSGSVAGVCTRAELRRRLLLHGIPAAGRDEVLWLAREGGALDALRADLPEPGRARLLDAARREIGTRGERALSAHAAESLFAASVAVAREAGPVDAEAPRPLVRLRDRLLEATGVDCDELVHPLLVRACAAFLDQGIAAFPAPGREQGFHRWFVGLFATEPAPHGDPFMRALARLARDEAAAMDDARGEGASSDIMRSLARSLDALGVAEPDRAQVLVLTALALRGWAGMVRQIEERPDRVPASSRDVTLAAFLAVRLLAERAALAQVARTSLGFEGPLSVLADGLPRAVAAAGPSVPERAWSLFHATQLLGLAAGDLRALGAEGGGALLREIEAFSRVDQRRLLHLAYERAHGREVLDALGRHRPAPPADRPVFQAVFCIDEREESLRRHLEEVAPGCRTFGAAGFFGVAMYFKGAADARSRPLCPIALRPEHEVEELPLGGAVMVDLRRSWRRGVGHLSRGLSTGSRTFVRGTIISALMGALASIPLVMRVLFPRATSRMRRRGAGLVRPPRRTRLALDRREGVAPSEGRFSGYTKEEMAGIVRGQLEALGLTSDFAELVLVVGHGSSSLNNPHESAHDCGACGGGHGGPNARAFAQMANDGAVRSLLAEQGIVLPAGTWLVGAEHNTCDDRVELFDLDLVPARHAALLRDATDALREAARRNAQERCRRFDNAPTWLPSELAKLHVEARAEDLAQPRPEYGHATNAVCVVGRRDRTRGLFLDRRAFLVSYDPTTDDAPGSVLARVLSAAVPVVAGINLEYYFGYVDPRGYGSGTKAPHNVTGLLGVMDGHQSDLRTGLPWQMLEIHEPVRLLLVVEAPVARMREVIARDPALRRLVDHRWIRLATLDPDGPAVHVHGAAGFERHAPGGTLPDAPSSRRWYRGRRGPVAPAAVRGGAPPRGERAR